MSTLKSPLVRSAAAPATTWLPFLDCCSVEDQVTDLHQLQVERLYSSRFPTQPPWLRSQWHRGRPHASRPHILLGSPPNPEHFSFLLPKTMLSMVVGARHLKHWVLGPSGQHTRPHELRAYKVGLYMFLPCFGWV